MKILIADDSTILRSNLKKLLSSVKEINSVMEAETIEETKEIIREYKPDIIILDINFPSGSGFDVLKYAKEEVWVPLVIMLTNYSNEKFRIKSLLEGANYFFDKSTEFEKVIAVIQDASKFFNN